MKKLIFSFVLTVSLTTFIVSGSVKANTESYFVKPGDSLWKIAVKHNLTVDKLKELNGLTSDMIRVDQKLIFNVLASSVPKPPISEKKYTTIFQAGKKVTILVPEEAFIYSRSETNRNTDDSFACVI